MTTFLRRRALPLIAILTAASSVLYIACDDDTNAVKEPPVTPDGGSPPVDSGPNPTDSGTDSTTNPDTGPNDCVTNPTTHVEIINACTTAVRITKNPTLSKLLPDGGLPPLP